MYRYLGFLILVLGLATPISAQHLERSHIAATTQSPEVGSRTAVPAIVVDSTDRAATVGGMLISGIAMGAIGLFAGGYAGYAAETSAGCMDKMFCGVGGAILGGLIGESIGMSTGIHYGGGRRHSFAGDFGVALGIAALGLIATPVTYGASLLAVPVVQLIVGVNREVNARHR